MPSAPVLVTGATGQQGGAVVRALRRAGVPVRALVRDPETPRAQAVRSLGATVVVGDLDDPRSLPAAVDGVRSVFSVQMPVMTDSGADFGGEVRQATALVEAATAAGVPQFVQSTVAGAGDHTSHPDWAPGRWAVEASLTAKAAVQDLVRAAGFARWTLLKPGTFMENFLPTTGFMFPRGLDGGLVTVLDPDTVLSLVAVDDIGAAAAAAVLEPERFDRVALELTGDRRSVRDIAAVLSEVSGQRVQAPAFSHVEAIAAGMPPALVAHEWLNRAGQPGRPQDALDLGIAVTDFPTWAATRIA
ncbi:NmrA/HSCARG family protein [Phycicoccus avicenniae]|uniref:NmrA/HSCARG family protein n=1 Tax=Phycicoccus avicenniae TaxID=2828860 RepID=UPI003D2B90B9